MRKANDMQDGPKAVKKTKAPAAKAAKAVKPATAAKPVASPKSAPATKAKAPARPQPAAEPSSAEQSAATIDSVTVAPRLVSSTAPLVTGPEMKKRDLLDKVVKRSGIKKRDAKPVVEAMLAVMGEAMAEGRELNLQPFGRLKTNRVKETGNGRVLICKLRQGGGEDKGADRPAKEALAETDD